MFETFDWEVGNESASYQMFIGTSRFQPWPEHENRLTVALEAAKFYNYTSAIIVLECLIKLIANDRKQRVIYIETLPAFLKKSLVPTAATIFGRMDLRRKEFQLKYFSERLKTWVGTEHTWGSINGRDSFEEVMSRVDILIECGEQSRVVAISLDDHIANRTWMKPGASSIKDMIPRGFSSTKSSLGMTNTNEQIREALDDNYKIFDDPLLYEKELLNPRFNFSLHAKPEPMKTRAVIADLFDLYLYMHYISYYIVPYVGKNRYMYQTYSEDQKFTFWSEAINMMGREQAIDLDFTTWDESVLKRVVVAIVDVLCKKAYGLSGRHPDVLMVWKRIMRILEVVGILVDSEDGFVRQEWKNGLITGFLWTWLINALVNLGIQMYVSDLTGIHHRVMLAQGDDIHMEGTYTLEDYEKIKDVTTQIGLVVNQAKSTFSDDGGGEFLSLHINRDGISGNKERMIRSLTWGGQEMVEGSGQIINKTEKSKLDARVSIWNQYKSRGGYVNPLWVRDDLFGTAKRTIKKSLLLELLYASPSVGGFGLFDNKLLVNYDWVSNSPEPRPIMKRLKQRNYNKANAAWARGVRSVTDSLKKDPVVREFIKIKTVKGDLAIPSRLNLKLILLSHLPPKVGYNLPRVMNPVRDKIII